MEKLVKPGVKINIFGKITFFNGDIQITGEKFIIVNNYYVENLFNEIPYSSTLSARRNRISFLL